MNKTGCELNRNNTCNFKVWAPLKDRMTLHIVHPIDRKVEMAKDSAGYFTISVPDIKDDCRYYFNPDGKKDFPDPASNFQPEGVHGPSAVVAHESFRWHDTAWRGIPQKDLIFYELHVGTFTSEGTFEAIIPVLPELADVGVNAIELMPVAQFPGNRNWGYDGVYPFAVQNSYGGPEGLKRLVDACHAAGIAVFLDVVYNHLGPEGNYFAEFAPYFSSKHVVPWGDAINFDGDWSDGVREFFTDNACFWFENYHIDGLRLDAIHMVYDFSAVHFWELLREKVNLAEQRMGRKFYLIAESDLNSPKVVKTPELGGFGFDGQWLDDFHHALYVLLDKKGKDRYEDFGSMEQLAKAYTDGFVHSGEYVQFRRRKHGASSAGVAGEKFVAFNQNHDQIGNRVLGERLSVLVDFERLKLASAALFLSPYNPLLFMGEEYGEDNPFFYFVSHSDKALIKAVREGRKKEFESYKWHTDPPDPQAESTFTASKPDRSKKDKESNNILFMWHKKLI
ncbi:MAG TPA: malto-oligosyltrehalose trehalohydrolase, partial [Bacteroidales bacterium]|nr:malto-oligosyltrehalose trehalohydrolase [Bacteroidales bacterium]